MKIFTAIHVLIIVFIPLCAWILASWAQRKPYWGQRLRFLLAALIGVNELYWYGYVLYQGWFQFPYGLPLDLCDLVLWLTVFTLVTSKSWSFDLIFYWGLIGTSMAVLTPDIGAPFPSYIAIKFLFTHGAVVMSILFLLWSKNVHPNYNSWWKALLWLNIYAVVIGSFNLIFQTNYFYLCQKPLSGSLLDYLGDWPWYIISGEGLAFVLFLLLWLPFRKSKPELHQVNEY